MCRSTGFESRDPLPAKYPRPSTSEPRSFGEDVSGTLESTTSRSPGLGVRPGGFIPPFRADTYGFRQRERDLGSFWQRAMMAVSKFLGLIQGAASFGCLSIQRTLSARIQCSSDGYVV